MTILSLDGPSDLTQTNLKKLEEMVSKQNTVLLNHANWCGHCQVFKPQWEEFKKSAVRGVNLVQIENEALSELQKHRTLYKKVTPKDGAVYFPMIIVFIKKGTKPVEKKVYDGNRTAEDLKTFVQSKVKVEKKASKKVENARKNGVKAVKGTTASSKKTSGFGGTHLSLFELNKQLDQILAGLGRA